MLISDKFKSLSTRNKVIFTIIPIIIMMILIAVLYNMGNQTIIRILETDIMNGQSDTFVTRYKTLMYYLPLILVSPFGHGFGRIIPLINQFHRFHGSSNFTDNAFINKGMKTGLIGMLIFICFIIYFLVRLIRLYHCTAQTKYITHIVFFSGYIVTSAIMAGQIMNNYSISIFFVNYCIAVLFYNSKDDLFIKRDDERKEVL